MSDQEEIRDLIGRYVEAADRGRERDLAAHASVPLLRHHVSNVRIHVDGSTARSDSYFLAITDLGPDHWGRYRDDLVRADGRGWRFAYRRVVVEGSVEGSFTRDWPGKPGSSA